MTEEEKGRKSREFWEKAANAKNKAVHPDLGGTDKAAEDRRKAYEHRPEVPPSSDWHPI